MAIEFISGSTAEVEENVSTSIYTAQVTDTNESGGSISFELGEGSDPGLTIDPETGIVTVSNGLDYETKSSYSFTVIATNESGDSSEIQVTINVTNLDEADPTITSADLVSVNEGIGSDQVVYTATATDGNDISGGVVYSLAEGSDSVLSIDANSGAVTLTDDPDASTKDTYTFTVVATDAAGNSVSEDVTLRINRIVSGTEGNDTIANTSSNDVVSAGKGADVFSYSGNYDDYNVSLIAGGSVRVVNLASPSEVDVLSGFESLQFADRTINIQIVYTAGEDILVNTQTSDTQYRS
ncbi:MAG: cadherin repeat domain-containing protein, partial [Betaproteobacteria bacterium]